MDTVVRDAPRPRLRLRRSPAWLVAGVLAVCLGGLGSAFVHLSVAASEPVLRVNRTIHRGEVIERADLSVVAAPRGLDVPTVGEPRLGEVVGRAALNDLPSGGLLVEGAWGDPGLQPGSSRIGLRLQPGSFPATDLRPGTPLLVVALPAAAGAGGQAEPLPGSVRGALVAAPALQPDGSFTFDLDVPTGHSEVIARLAASERVTLVGVGSVR